MFSKKVSFYFLSILEIFLSFWDIVVGKQISDSDGEVSDGFTFSSTQAVVAFSLSSIAFLVVVVIVLMKCADCYNSEVSSENHPACGGGNSTTKWGGAGGYMANNTGPASATFGETVDIGSNSGGGGALPYTMIPTSIPEQAGFQGYQTAGSGDGSNRGGGLMGYQQNSSASAYQQNSSASAPPPDGGAGGRHFNPAEEQAPPPAYTEVLRQSSLQGYR